MPKPKKSKSSAPPRLDVLCPTCGERMAFLADDQMKNCRFACPHEHVFTADDLMTAR